MLTLENLKEFVSRQRVLAAEITQLSFLPAGSVKSGLITEVIKEQLNAENAFSKLAQQHPENIKVIAVSAIVNSTSKQLAILRMQDQINKSDNSNERPPTPIPPLSRRHTSPTRRSFLGVGPSNMKRHGTSHVPQFKN